MAKTTKETENLPVVSVIPEIAELKNLEPAALERVNALYQSMTASPEGIEQETHWRPDTIRLRHPITNDPLMPTDTEVGDLYIAGRTLWSNANDGRNRPLKFVICYAHLSRARFPQGENRPDCTSSDGVWNDHGTMKCIDCPSLPFRDGKKTDCNNTLNVVLLPLDMSGVYIARFSKTSYKAGSNMLKILKGQAQSWNQVFGLTTKENHGSKNSWWVYQTAPISEAVPPEVTLFANYISAEYGKSREAFLASLKEARENAAAGMDALEGIGEEAEIDDDGFTDSM